MLPYGIDSRITVKEQLYLTIFCCICHFYERLIYLKLNLLSLFEKIRYFLVHVYSVILYLTEVSLKSIINQRITILYV